MTSGRKSLSIFTELICNLILYINTGSDKNRINSTPLTQRDWFPHQLSQCSTQKAGVNPLKQKLSRPAIVSGIKYLNMKSAEKKLKLAPLVLCIGAAGRESGAETHVWYTHCRTRWAKRTRRRTQRLLNKCRALGYMRACTVARRSPQAKGRSRRPSVVVFIFRVYKEIQCSCWRGSECSSGVDFTRSGTCCASCGRSDSFSSFDADFPNDCMDVVSLFLIAIWMNKHP